MKVLFGKILEGIQGSAGDGDSETKRRWRDRVVGRVRGFEERV